MPDIKTPAPQYRLDRVVTQTPVNFFNIGGSQLAATMTGIHLTWNPQAKRVHVTHDSYPGQEYWIHESAILFTGWREVEA